MIEALFRKQYNPEKYHCVHFVIDAAKEIYQADYAHCFVGMTGSLSETIKSSKQNLSTGKRIQKPKDGCVVLMTNYDESSHVGLYYKDRVFHLTERGVQRPTLEQIKLMFKRIRFYEPNLHH